MSKRPASNPGSRVGSRVASPDPKRSKLEAAEAASPNPPVIDGKATMEEYMVQQEEQVYKDVDKEVRDRGPVTAMNVLMAVQTGTFDHDPLRQQKMKEREEREEREREEEAMRKEQEEQLVTQYGV